MVGGKKRKIKDFLTYAVLILFACIFTLPTAAMVGTAFKGDTRHCRIPVCFRRVRS